MFARFCKHYSKRKVGEYRAFGRQEAIHLSPKGETVPLLDFMAVEKFIEYKFTKETQAIANEAVAICASYRRQGYDLSLRQLYYQL
jgi:hypothetical protein